MNNFRFHTPTEVVFGKGVENHTGALAAKHGTRALIVYGKGSVVKSGLLARVTQSLKDAGLECEAFGGAQPNPDIIIGVGGGSAIDTAKGIAHGAANPGKKLWDIWTKKDPLTKSLPVGAVLTMPAAGSEMSDSAVLTNTGLGKKAGLGTEFNRCRFAVINPEWGATLPPYQLAAGVTDIMMHTMERYFIPGIKCDLTDEIAEGLLRTVIKNGAAAVKDPSDYDSMAEVFWASSLSHNNLTECGRGKDFSVHKLGHPLSARFGVTHGASLACVWGAWASTLYRDALPRFAQFGRRVWNVCDSDDETAAKQGIEKTVAFFRSIGMPVCLADLKVEVTEDILPQLALDATANDTLRLSRIRPLKAKDIEAIYRFAMTYSE